MLCRNMRLTHILRHFVTSHRARSQAFYSLSHSTLEARNNTRALLRQTAQPVAVVTSFMPTSENDKHDVSNGSPRFHGATLSSFSSIAMDPYPLVSFSLRIPSRMATSLTSSYSTSPKVSYMVINILSAAQADVAVRFSRPDLHKDPFVSTPYHLTEEGLPVIEGSLGALSCTLVTRSWPLHDLQELEQRTGKQVELWQGDGVASELFIARVARVELLAPSNKDESPRTSPLLYFRRAYATTCDISPHQGPAHSGEET